MTSIWKALQNCLAFWHFEAGPRLSPNEEYEYLTCLAERLHQDGYDADHLKEVLKGAYTTRSEWLIEIQVAVRRILKQKKISPKHRKQLYRVMKWR
jgi:hypothetical protein